jgi:hypothetical protein
VPRGVISGAGGSPVRGLNTVIETLGSAATPGSKELVTPSKTAITQLDHLPTMGLARALVGNREIVFLDNPTAGLDPILTAIIATFIATSLKAYSDQGGRGAPNRGILFAWPRGTLIWIRQRDALMNPDDV